MKNNTPTDIWETANNTPSYLGYDIIKTDTVTSTNTVLKEMAKDGLFKKTALIAKHQTNGRGRLGRSFYSPKDSGLYLSLFLPVSCVNLNIMGLTSAAGVSVCRGLKDIADVNPMIKWVNDVYLNNKKICGILAEAATDIKTGKLTAIIIGIGVNCTTKDFPSDLPNAASVDPGGNLDTYALALSIINHLDKILNGMDFIKEYKKRSLVLNKEIIVLNNNRKAYVKDIDKDGGLVIQYVDNNKDDVLKTGEISIHLCND